MRVSLYLSQIVAIEMILHILNQKLEMQFRQEKIWFNKSSGIKTICKALTLFSAFEITFDCIKAL